MSETGMPGYREWGECNYIHACTHVCICGAQWSSRPDLQWSLDEQKKLYNALTNKVRELQSELAEAKAECERLMGKSCERTAQLVAHRACIGAEHDPQNGKIHGCCIVCGIDWPCMYAGIPPNAEQHNAKLVEACKAAQAAIDDGGRHRWNCKSLGSGGYFNPLQPCSCGLDTVARQLESALANPAEKENPT